MKKYTHFGLVLTLILTIVLAGCGGGGGNPPSNDPPLSDPPSSDPPKHGNNYYLYVTNAPDKISAFSINPDNGGLTNIYGSPFSAGTSPSSVAADPSGEYLYVANFLSSNISIYSINAVTGVLNKITDSSTNNNPQKITIDPTGNFVAVGCNYYLNIFSRDKSSGTLADNPTSITFGSNQELRAVSFDRTGQFLYVAVSTGSIYVYAKNAESNTFTQFGDSVSTCSGPSSLAIDSNGKFLYVATSSSTAISIHPINGNGSLAAGTMRNILAQSSRLLIQGNFLYITKVTGIAAYSIMADGSISGIGVDIPCPDGIQPNSLAVDATGKFLYATGWYSNYIWGFAITADGSLLKITDNPIDSGAEISSIVTVKTTY